MNTRIIGIDLAVTAAHKAIVLDQASNTYVSRLLTFHTDPADLDHVLDIARAGASEPVRLQAVLEATGMAWYTVGQYLERHNVDVYRVNGQQVADLRRVYQRHAKSDRIDARVLARLPLVMPDSLHRCFFPSGPLITLQRACREVKRLKELVTASKNRILATDQVTWLGLKGIVPPFSPLAFWLRENWYDPWRVQAVGVGQLAQAWQTTAPEEPVDVSWAPTLFEQAERVITLYHSPDLLDYAQFQVSLQREQARLCQADEQAHHLRLKTVRPLYRQLHPSLDLETLRGVGQDSAAIYIAFIGDIQRFPSLRDFLGWTGLIPFSRQSGDAQARGLRVTKAGPNLVKATAFLNAGIARQWDPQIAAVYYQQMMKHGKHHLQAVCACATHLLTRVYAVLRDDRPYELRDVDGTPVDKHTARHICQVQYHVPDEVRQRNNRRVRKARQEARLEKRRKRKRRR
ncbi:MAG: IS110 family transposase [Anaerolineae bacterium]|jgi:transposase